MNVADQFKQYEYFWQTDPNTGAVWLDQCAVIGDEIEIPHQGGREDESKWFTCVRLLDSPLTEYAPPRPATFTTKTLNPRRDPS